MKTRSLVLLSISLSAGIALAGCKLSLVRDLSSEGLAPAADTNPPSVSILSQPASTEYLNSAAFTFTGSDAEGAIAGYECSLDGGAYSSCSASTTFSNLATGSHTVSVRAIDAAGNRSSASSVTWTAYAWKKLDQYTAPGPWNATHKDLFRDGSGNFYSLVWTARATAGATLFRRSTDGGVTWANWCESPKGFSRAIFASPGTLYAIGSEVSGTAQVWKVWKSTDSCVSWTEVDSYQWVANQSAEPRGIAIDSAGRIYVAGMGRESVGEYHWIVRRSVDGGTTWSTVRDYQLVADKSAEAYDIEVDSSDRIWVVGRAEQTNYPSSRWMVERSADQGSSWSSLDSFFDTMATFPECISIGASGTIYVGGRSNYNRMTIRASSDDGASWSTLDNTMVGTATHPTAIRSILETSGGDIYYTGYRTLATAGSSYIVRKSTDAGSSWTTVRDQNLAGVGDDLGIALGQTGSGALLVAAQANDSATTRAIIDRSTDGGSSWTTPQDFREIADTHFIATSLTRNAAGHILAAGWGGTQKRWLVRVSADNGVSWSTLDDFVPSAYAAAWPNALGVTSSGAILVGGAAGVAPNNFWTVRRSADGGATWTTVDSYQYSGVPNYRTNEARGFGTDASGGLYFVGVGTNGAGSPRWIVRKSIDDGVTWSTVDDFANGGTSTTQAEGMARDSLGNLYVAGTAANASAARLVLRKSTNAGATWSTIDDYSQSPLSPMYGTGIAIDSSDNLYQMSNFAGLNCWVRRSTNGGASWNDVLVNPFGGFCNAGQLAVDTTNRVYAFVSYRFNTPIDPYRGYVYSSSDAGLTWTLIDDPSDFSPMGWDRTGSVFRDPNGGIFMTGSAPDAQGVQRFLIKRIDL